MKVFIFNKIFVLLSCTPAVLCGNVGKIPADLQDYLIFLYNYVYDLYRELISAFSLTSLLLEVSDTIGKIK